MTWCRASNWGWLRNRLARASESVLYTTIIYATTNLLAAGWNEVQNSANQRIFYHWRGFFGRTLMKPFECACQSIAESFDFEMFSTHDNIWLDGMDFLTMTKAPGCTQSYCICIMEWNNVDPGLEMPFIATAISDVENVPLGGILYAPSTNLWEMSWKNSTKQCDNVHTAGEYSDIQDYAISMSNIGYATLYSKLPTWQWVRGVTCYISYCPVYISEFQKGL